MLLYDRIKGNVVGAIVKGVGRGESSGVGVINDQAEIQRSNLLSLVCSQTTMIYVANFNSDGTEGDWRGGGYSTICLGGCGVVVGARATIEAMAIVMVTAREAGTVTGRFNGLVR